MILMYHRVLPPEAANRYRVEPGMWVSPKAFERHMEALVQHFSVMPLHEVVAGLGAGRPLPPRACAITFDDGWRDNLQHALPVLEKKKLPATIFVVTDRVGTSGAFWPDEVARRYAGLHPSKVRDLLEHCGLADAGSLADVLDRLKQMNEGLREEVLASFRAGTRDSFAEERQLLDWDELRILASKGIDIESHGMTHAILTKSTSEVVRRELSGSLEALKARGHGRHGLLAYPSGGFDESMARLAKEAGYRGAVTTQHGVSTHRHTVLSLPRVGVHEDISRTRVEFLRWVPGTAYEG